MRIERGIISINLLSRAENYTNLILTETKPNFLLIIKFASLWITEVFSY